MQCKAMQSNAKQCKAKQCCSNQLNTKSKVPQPGPRDPGTVETGSARVMDLESVMCELAGTSNTSIVPLLSLEKEQFML